MTSEEKIRRLKKEKKILKSILKKIDKMDLYHVDYDEYYDDIEQINIPFNLKKVVEYQTRDEEFEIRQKILSYFRKK